MKEWGTELWDRLDQIVLHNKKELNDLEGVYGKFLKERAEVEKEYCKGLRKLVANYTPKESKKEDKDEETSQTKGFRSILQETKYQANQHESLAEVLSKTLYASIQKKIKEFDEVLKKSAKEAKRLAQDKEKSDKVLERTKGKYIRNFLEWEHAEIEFKKGESSNDVSRNQIAKLKKSTESRKKMFENSGQDYASELIRVNKEQHTYFYLSLPMLLNNLQNLDISRTNFVKEVLRDGLKAEKEILPIVMKCLDEMDSSLESIDASQDTQLVIYRFKTGNVPPDEIPFEELKLGVAGQTDKYKTLQKRSKATPPTDNLFPRKRQLEKEIEAIESDILKGQKEIHALRLMYETYSQNPQFGDKSNFRGELEAATFKVQNLESERHLKKTELSEIEAKLENKRNRTPVDTPVSGRRSPSHSDRGSVGYGTISNSSNSSEQDTDSLGEKSRVPEVGTSWDPASSVWPEDDFPEEFEDLPPPPSNHGLARALYEFRGTEISNIDMDPGEEFHIVDPDSGGWTKVQRMNMSEEGFVPTAFLETIS